MSRPATRERPGRAERRQVLARLRLEVVAQLQAEVGHVVGGGAGAPPRDDPRVTERVDGAVATPGVDHEQVLDQVLRSCGRKGPNFHTCLRQILVCEVYSIGCTVWGVLCRVYSVGVLRGWTSLFGAHYVGDMMRGCTIWDSTRRDVLCRVHSQCGVLTSSGDVVGCTLRGVCTLWDVMYEAYSVGALYCVGCTGVHYSVPHGGVSGEVYFVGCTLQGALSGVYSLHGAPCVVYSHLDTLSQ